MSALSFLKEWLPATKRDLRNTEDKIMAKVNQLGSILTAIADQVAKVKVEVQAVKDALANTDLPPDAQAALDRLTTEVQGVDDLNPDAVK